MNSGAQLTENWLKDVPLRTTFVLANCRIKSSVELRGVLTTFIFTSEPDIFSEES